MGWSSGSSLYDEVIATLQKHISDADTRRAIHREMIAAFEDYDCDTLCECEGQDPAFDAAVRELHPDHYEDEEE
jgi:predicted NAD/FAD-binding protein